MKLQKSLKRILASPLIGIILALVASNYFQFIDEDIVKILYYSFGFIVLIYTIIILIIYINNVREKHKWQKQFYFSCIYQKIIHDWQINEQGDFFLRTQFSVKNIGNDYLDFLPIEKGLFFKRLKGHKLVLKVLNSDYKLVEYKNFFTENIFNYLNIKKTFNLGWSFKVSPALKPNDILTYEKRIDTLGTETAAFLDKGTYAGVPANIPIKEVQIRYITPPRYKFELLEPIIIVRFDGSVIKEVPNNISNPKLNSSGTVLTWNLKNLNAGMRYSFKYRIIKEK